MVDRATIDLAMQQLEALNTTMRTIDAAVPRIRTNRVRVGQNAQDAFEDLFATGGILHLDSGYHPHVLRLPARANPALIVIRGEGEASLRGFIGGIGSRHVTFEDCRFVDPVGERHLNFGEGRVRGADGVWRHVMLTLDQVPSGFIFRRIHGIGPCAHGIVLNAADVLMEDCSWTNYISTAKDSQAIAMYNGARNIRIINTLLEAASENVLIGGADAASEEMFPQDIFFERITLTKRESWMENGGTNRLKCLFEIKNGLRVTVQDSVLENSLPGMWRNSPAFVIKASNQEGTNPTARSEDILILRNRVSNVGHYVQVVGQKDGPVKVSGVCRRITIRNNHFGLMHRLASNSGHAITLVDGPEEVLIDHNTFEANRHSLVETGGTVGTTPIILTNNIARHGVYGLNRVSAPLDARCNALEVRSGIQPQWRPPAGSGNVYYPAPIMSQDLSQHVTTDGSPVGA